MAAPSSSIPKQAKHIVLTGGPCAGKTTALAHLYDHLSLRGWRVIVVPEAATIVLGAAGRLPGDRDAAFFAKAQTVILSLQRDLPLTLSTVLTGEEEKVVFLYDRAELDNRAYTDPETFESLVKATHGKTTWEVAERYDAVVHLVTAADGAAEAYTLANNEARTETPEAAKQLDEATRRAWLGHSHYTVIPNRSSFEQKLTSVLAAVLGILGEPEPVEVERKWLLRGAPNVAKLDATPVRIVQHYLSTPEGDDSPEVRLRARTVDKHTTYYRTVKTRHPARHSRVEHEQIISEETYRQLLAYRARGSKPVEKTRWCLVAEGQHFELDHVTSPVELWLLEAELVTADQPVTVPAVFGVVHEVTDDPTFSNAAIARQPAAAGAH